MNRTENNKRIAKNTVILYGRMLLMMLIGLYTSRVVIDALGFIDYGIYNIVGSVVGMFTVLIGSLSGAVGRFFTFELGRGDKEKLQTIFSLSINILLIAGLAVALIAEIGGVWYIQHKMVMPAERVEAAYWVFHCSIVVFMVSLLTVPYDAVIVAHERMSVYAYMSILDALFKLLIAWVIVVSPFDKLVSYAVLGLCVSIVMRFVYWFYCRRCFTECRYQLVFDRGIFKSMGEFASWNLLGSLSVLSKEQALNMVLNYFCGPIVNAARGIANTVSAATRSLSSSFMASSRPQITKSYAAGELQYSIDLVMMCSKLSFGLIFVVMLPILIDTHYLLSLWLVEIPNHAVWFVRLTLLYTLVDSFNSAPSTMIQATGNVKRDQCLSSVMLICTLPVSFFMLYVGFQPEVTLVISVVAIVFIMFIKVWILQVQIGFPAKRFIMSVWSRSLLVMLLSAAIPVLVCINMEESFVRFILLGALCISGSTVCILTIMCSTKERKYVKKALTNIVGKIRK